MPQPHCCFAPSITAPIRDKPAASARVQLDGGYHRRLFAKTAIALTTDKTDHG